MGLAAAQKLTLFYVLTDIFFKIKQANIGFSEENTTWPQITVFP